jgi:hypothetical protein
VFPNARVFKHLKSVYIDSAHRRRILFQIGLQRTAIISSEETVLSTFFRRFRQFLSEIKAIVTELTLVILTIIGAYRLIVTELHR